MEVQEIHNITEKDIASKRNNILIAICLGNKFFLNKNNLREENVSGYLQWALRNTKEKVLILIADEIQITNRNVRNKGVTSETNLKRILEDGRIIKSQLKELIKKFSKEDQKEIEIIDWEEYMEKDELCKSTTALIYKEFEENNLFRNEVFNTIRNTITDRRFSKEAYWKLCNYILDEFSVIYSGVKYEGDYYGILLYPYMDPTGYLMKDIMQKSKFPKLADKLPSKKITYVIMR